MGHAMLTLMLQIYLMSISHNIPYFNLKSYFLMGSIGFTMRIIISCLVNDRLYQEVDQLFLALDDINVPDSDPKGKLFKELIQFRTISRDLPNGFTIGGLMPLKRTTLLSVNNWIIDYQLGSDSVFYRYSVSLCRMPFCSFKLALTNVWSP